MKGRHVIEVSRKDVAYSLCVKRKYTIINDMTGNGKSRLIGMLRDSQRVISDVNVSASYNVYVAESLYALKGIVAESNEGFVVVDEEDYISTPEFDSVTQKSGMYFIIFSRSPLMNLTYSIDEIYEFRTNYSGKRRVIELNKFFEFTDVLDFKPEVLYTEDEGAGYQFYKSTLKDCDVRTTCGRSKIGDVVIKFVKSMEAMDFLVIADGAACGGNSDALMSVKHEAEKRGVKVCIFLPESFEFLLLSSSLFYGSGIENELKYTYDYADTNKYLSWEQYFEKRIKDLVGEDKFIDIKKSYKKGSLPKFFIRNSKEVYKVIRGLIPTERRYL